MIGSAEYGEVDGRPVRRHTVATAGLRATLIDFGARLVELHVPDRTGRSADIVLGPDDLAGFVASGAYFGATCGRYANRIAEGRFALDGREIQLDRNEGRNHVHGGRAGFDRKVWSATVDPDGSVIRFDAASADGEMGYPGACRATTSYAFSDHEMTVVMECVADAPTIVNLVHHSYFNLAGHDAGDVLGHEATFASDFYTPADAELLVTGEVRSVTGTPFDFRGGEAIGARIGELLPAAAGTPGGGYDHNLVLRGVAGELHDVVRMHDPASGRVLRLRATEPGVQFYSGGFLGDGETGKGGIVYRKFAGFAVETQRFPGSPTFAHFPSAVLRPGQRYRHVMEFEFSTDADDRAGMDRA